MAGFLRSDQIVALRRFLTARQGKRVVERTIARHPATSAAVSAGRGAAPHRVARLPSRTGRVPARASRKTLRENHLDPVIDTRAAALCFASGMAASHALLAGRLSQDDHLVMADINV